MLPTHAISATIFPIVRLAVTTVGPVFFTGIRMLTAGSMFLVYYRIYHGSLRRTLAPGGVVALVTAVFSTYGANTFESWGLLTVSAGKAAFLYSSTPFYVAILSFFVFGERLTRRKITGMVIGFIGFIVMVYGDILVETSKGGWWVISTGEVLLVFAAISASIAGVATRQLIRVYAMPPLLLCGTLLTFAGLSALMTSPFVGEVWAPLPVIDYNIFLMTFALTKRYYEGAPGTFSSICPPRSSS